MESGPNWCQIGISKDFSREVQYHIITLSRKKVLTIYFSHLII